MSVQTEPVSLVELWAEDHARLRLEITRLKALIKATLEPSQDHHRCVWCLVSLFNNEDPHEADCPAFTPTGEVR